MKAKNGIPNQESDLALRLLLSSVMSGCSKDRQQIATELSQKTGRAITVSILNDYTATTKASARFPAAYVREFCEVTGNDELLRFLFTSDIRDLVRLGECEREMGRQQRAKAGLVKGLLADVEDRRS
jgi:hypothetical protein